jgi:hypothetical protein
MNTTSADKLTHKPELPSAAGVFVGMYAFYFAIGIAVALLALPVAWVFVVLGSLVLLGIGILYQVERSTSRLQLDESGFAETYLGSPYATFAWSHIGPFCVDSLLSKPTVSFVDKQGKKHHLGYGRPFVFAGDHDRLCCILNKHRTRCLSKQSSLGASG